LCVFFIIIILWFFVSREDNDDINDVATMGGVNLSEESKNILATNAEFIGSQIRSCQDKTFLPQDVLMGRIAAIGQLNFAQMTFLF
jgi:transcription initiation factor TFIID subunit 4